MHASALRVLCPLLDLREHKLEVVHGLVEERAPIIHALGLGVGLDLAHADLDLHALAEDAAVVERHVGSLVQVAAQRVPGSG